MLAKIFYGPTFTRQKQDGKAGALVSLQLNGNGTRLVTRSFVQAMLPVKFVIARIA
jgi:hypothetical protein